MPCAQLRSRRTHVIVYARGYFEIFETLSLVQLVLKLPHLRKIGYGIGLMNISKRSHSENDLPQRRTRPASLPTPK